MGTYVNNGKVALGSQYTYNDAVKETERLTDKRIELDEGTKNILNSKLQTIIDNINDKPKIVFIYFVD